jgi:outer membrane protein assembly factor BamB
MSPKRNLWSAALPVAVAVAVAAGVLPLSACTNEGGEPDPWPGYEDGGDIEQLWATPKAEGGRGATNYVVNEIWVTDSAIVNAQSAGVSAHDPATGEELWRVEPPDGAEELCNASTGVNADGIGALLFSVPGEQGALRDYPSCRVVAAVDTHTGEVLWSHELPGDSFAQQQPLTVGARVIAVSLGMQQQGDSFFRFAIAGGEELPTLETPGGERCRPYRWVQSARYTVGASDCRTPVFDTESGELLRYLAPADQEHFPIGVLPGERLALWGRQELVSYRDDGQSEIPVPPDNVSGFWDAVVADGVLIKRTNDDGSTQYSGWDLETGERLWDEDLFGFPEPPGADGRVALQYGVYGDDEHLAWLNPRDGSLVDGGTFPAGTSYEAFGMMPDGDRLYAVRPDTQDDRLVSLVAYDLPD